MTFFSKILCLVTFCFSVSSVNCFADSLFQKGTVNPEKLYPVNITDRASEDIILLSVMQGVIAKKSSVQLYLYNTKDSGYKPTDADKKKGLNTGMLFFKNYLTKIRQPAIPEVENPAEDLKDIINEFKQYIQGYIIYDINTDTQDMAVTLSGIKNCIPVTENNESIVKSLGFKKIVDLRGTTYNKFIDSYGDNINKNFVIELALMWGGTNTKADGPKDYASMLNGMMFYSGSTSDTRELILDYIAKSNKNPIPVYGWNADSGDEGRYVNDVGSAGDFVVASDNSVNLSFFSSSNTVPNAVANNSSNIEYNPDMSYVAFIISDGDNLQFVTNKANDERWWGNTNRGKFPVGWTIPPALYYLEPDVWNYFVSTSTDNDELVVGPSGIGYVFGTVAGSPDEKFGKQQSALADFMSSSGIKTVCIFGESEKDWNSKEFIGAYTENDSIEGAFYSQFTPWMSQTTYINKILNNKPIIPENEYLNNNADTIANDINKNLTGKNKGFYAVYAIRNDDCNTMDWLNTLYEKLDKNKVKVVLPSQLIDLEVQSQKE